MANLQQIKRRFLEISTYLSTSPENSGISDNLELSSMLRTWIEVQLYLWPKSKTIQSFCQSIISDEDLFEEYCDRLNRMELTADDVETIYLKVYEPEELEKQDKERSDEMDEIERQRYI